MKSFAKIVALGAALAASSSLALADQISVAGNNVTYNNTTEQIFFCQAGTAGCTYVAGLGTGIFSPVSDGTVSFTTTTLNYGFTGPYTVPVFSISNNGVTDTFYAQSAVNNSADGFLDVTGFGFYTDSALPGQDIAGMLRISTQEGDVTTNVSFAATGTTSTTAVTPEPNSLLLMGTGLIGAAGLLFMRRRAAGQII